MGTGHRPRRPGTRRLTTVSEDTGVEHYDRLADRFNLNWAHSRSFVSWMSTCITERLNPQPGERALDLGCGTGLYSQCLAHRTGTVVCLDQSAKMLGQLPANQALIPVQGTAQELIGGAVPLPHEQYDVILAKEILHHIPRNQRPDLLHGVAGMLAPGGRMLLILMPPTIEHPLFEAALRRYERRPIEPVGIANVLEAAGLRATVTSASFRLELPKHRWLAMIRDRYMSLLTKFDDRELEAGIIEIDTRHPGPLLHFNDRYIFIQGYA
jgi:SAM-dependent methyltransferase